MSEKGGNEPLVRAGMNVPTEERVFAGTVNGKTAQGYINTHYLMLVLDGRRGGLSDGEIIPGWTVIGESKDVTGRGRNAGKMPFHRSGHAHALVAVTGVLVQGRTLQVQTVAISCGHGVNVVFDASGFPAPVVGPKELHSACVEWFKKTYDYQEVLTYEQENEEYWSPAECHPDHLR